MPPTRWGCPGSHPNCPWTPVGMGHPKIFWAEKFILKSCTVRKNLRFKEWRDIIQGVRRTKFTLLTKKQLDSTTYTTLPRAADLPSFVWMEFYWWAFFKNVYQSKLLLDDGERNLQFMGLVVSFKRDFLLSRAEKILDNLRTRSLGVSEAERFKKD